jgi:hypothetical protein
LKLFIRVSLVCGAFLALTGQTPGPEFVPDDGADFCMRLGRSIGIDEAKLAERRGAWTANALNFGQRFLVGGTASTSVAVEPIEPATVEDYKRASAMCETEGKGAVCRLSGPANFKFGWKGEQTVTPIRPDETAIVSVKGSKASCQSGAAGPK